MKFRRIFALLFILSFLVLPALAADSSESLNTAGALYSKSVDMANAGNYQEALDAADNALAMNVTSLTALIQSNRAGILVMLNRNDEAITAADAALAVEGNLTTVHSIAWYNKGNALRALGRIDEARTAYANANALDPTLVAPALPSGTITVQPTTVPVSGQSPVATSSGVPRPSATKSPLSLPVVFISLFAALACCRYFRAAEK
ncbi:tetratricopeptide repeat protein [Methanoregula sp.]|jgi:tetratricopeptide (TPR) repeat protein|uniref:tetratricopeptide repeat protein n=1 Tax=Methanoregula sp. TaxID=2052170 RepID=UPI003C24F388